MKKQESPGFSRGEEVKCLTTAMPATNAGPCAYWSPPIEASIRLIGSTASSGGE